MMNNQKIRRPLACILTHVFTICVLVVLLTVSCQTQPGSRDNSLKSDLPAEDGIVGLAGPFRLNVDTTYIQLSDYFNDPSAVESAEMPAAGVEAGLTDHGAIRIVSGPDMPALAGLEVVVDGQPRTLVCMKSKLRKYTFSFDTEGRAYETVQIKGEMNAWNVNAQEMQEENGIYSAEFLLEPKPYQYCMVLDGKEALDKHNPDSVSNGFGGFNSVMNPFGAERAEPLYLRTVSVEGDLVRLAASRKADDVIVTWENFRLPVQVTDGEVVFAIPDAARQQHRSFIRAWASSAGAVSNDVLIPLHEGRVLESAEELDRMDKHAMVLYNVFVDRFFNGDPSNDRPLNRPDVHPRADNHGGDIRGATIKVEEGYFEDLGVNTVWISPIVKNVEGAFGKWPDPETKFSAYHGYWPVSFTSVDDRMGTEEDLHELVDAAHSRNMNVLLDFVANHVHEQHPFYQADKNVATDLYLPDGRLNTELWDEQRLTTWFDVFLPSLRLDDPFVYETLTDSAVYWLTEYGLDGFRHDATKHVPEIFWRTLTRKIKDKVVLQEDREVYQIGETYGTRELVGGYVNAGQLDGQFDFNVYDACVTTLVREDGTFEGLDQAVQASLEAFGHHHLMGNITGNQDRGRFISYAGGALKLEENAKVAGWTREVGVGDAVAYQKSALLMGIIATIPGLPVIYYGDEVGSYGGNDPDNRKMMFFDDLNTEQADLLQHTRNIFQFRKNCLPLIYGDMRIHYKDKNTYAFSRNYFDQKVIVVFNKSNSGQSLAFDLDEDQDASSAETVFGSHFIVDGPSVRVDLPANGFDIIILK
jgi:glycosidase